MSTKRLYIKIFNILDDTLSSLLALSFICFVAYGYKSAELSMVNTIITTT